MPRTCPRCSADAEVSSRFCPECGSAFVDTGAATAQIPLESSRDQLVGKTIGDSFAIEAVLGGGSFGTVYRGRQLGLDRAVAIKVPTAAIAADPVMAKRFAREARSAARVAHPGVVAIHAVGELVDGRPYLVMQLVEGEPLGSILAGGPVPAVRALGVVRAIASALAETHAAGVIHRDLKPSNIIWRRDRHGDDRIAIVDFGIAASKPGVLADATRLTHDGVIGTPSYMSPEQAHGEAVDARSDLYAVGCLLFELVTGAPPFAGGGVDVLIAHLGRPSPLPSSRQADVPAAVDRLCEKLLAKKPAERFQSADELVAAIDGAVAELSRPRFRRASLGSVSRPPGSPRSARSPRSRLVLGVALAGVLVAGGTTAWVVDHRFWGRSDAPAMPDEAPDSPTAPVVRDGSGRRAVDLDDGELVLHALVPDPIHAGVLVRPHFEIRNKLGQPVVAPELVITLEDDRGQTKGFSAQPHKGAGHYAFDYAFPRAGHYTLRVFPPSVDSSFEIPLDVR